MSGLAQPLGPLLVGSPLVAVGVANGEVEGTEAGWCRLGRLLAVRRLERGLTQHGLAALMPWSRSTIANMEIGRGPIRSDDFWRRCDELLGTGEELSSAVQWLRAREVRAAAARAAAVTELAAAGTGPAVAASSVPVLALEDGSAVELTVRVGDRELLKIMLQVAVIGGVPAVAASSGAAAAVYSLAEARRERRA
ncbi:hypothetical protein ACTI_31520 [Actinoplanes sp. OR16]|uniref:helix-turn-helix domain-containing protein n=1 Tax=Actinoplanes sp. OR16 TaxID=946334 RepID=UPI000F6DEDF3|nr:helix-turn-helix transcriptional regulator [Actinoplanes sp. OR16]BBH66467.1 hypothetical protein ACTI_31520 [Actinoplanes sp. OR16]